jgi:hypothetical protein
MDDRPSIVAHETRSLRDLLALRVRLLAEARARRSCELSGASFWRRVWIRLVMERDAWRRIFPPGALRAVGGGAGHG